MTAEACMFMLEKAEQCAQIFFALGDRTRLLLMAKLANRIPCSIAQLTSHSTLTRQAITKHLQVLQKVGLVQNTRRGRENLFELQDQTLNTIQHYLQVMSMPCECHMDKPHIIKRYQ